VIFPPVAPGGHRSSKDLPSFPGLLYVASSGITAPLFVNETDKAASKEWTLLSLFLPNHLPLNPSSATLLPVGNYNFCCLPCVFSIVSKSVSIEDLSPFGNIYRARFVSAVQILSVYRDLKVVSVLSSLSPRTAKWDIGSVYPPPFSFWSHLSLRFLNTPWSFCTSQWLPFIDLHPCTDTCSYDVGFRLSYMLLPPRCPLIITRWWSLYMLLLLEFLFSIPIIPDFFFFSLACGSNSTSLHFCHFHWSRVLLLVLPTTPRCVDSSAPSGFLKNGVPSTPSSFCVSCSAYFPLLLFTQPLMITSHPWSSTSLFLCPFHFCHDMINTGGSSSSWFPFFSTAPHPISSDVPFIIVPFPPTRVLTRRAKRRFWCPPPLTTFLSPALFVGRFHLIWVKSNFLPPIFAL